MNRCLLILPLIALASSLTGAAATPPQAGKEIPAHDCDYAQRTGVLATVWGELPTYNLRPKQLLLSQKSLRNRDRHAQRDGNATVDLLVNRDGSIREVVVVESSGDPAVDRAVRTSFVGAKFTAKIDPDDPAPFVFRQKVVFVSNHTDHRTDTPYRGATYQYEPAPTYGPVDRYPTSNYSYVVGDKPPGN